ncbi:hypothetical protein C8R46DRAFT_1190644 [Mycena filopes]|nr:hypothetical protein C8R46DRAFT_1190644 [Mycena filopes]
MPLLRVFLFSLLLIFNPGADARNNWSIPCKGSCSYDSSDPAVSASVTISGASRAVSDITPAAGWTILACDASALAQDIRLVCHDPACQHLFEGQGAVDTLVRLPETCGLGAFARVAKIRVDGEQQTLASSDINTYAGASVGNMTGTVFVLSVDADFAAIDMTKSVCSIHSAVRHSPLAPGGRTGPVLLSIKGYNSPAAQDDGDTTSKRDVRPLDTRNWTAFNSTNTIDLPPLHISESFPLLNATLSCDGESLSVSAAFETRVDATSVSIGLIVAGTVVPPALTELAVFGGLEGEVSARLRLLASATGTVSTGQLTLYSVALGGIDFPGLFSLGPTFVIYGEVDAELDAELALEVELAYTVAAKGFYPFGAQASEGSATQEESALTLSAHPDAALHGSITASLTPTLALGLQAFGAVTAEVFLDVVGSLNAGVSLLPGSKGKACVDADVSAALGVNVGAQGELFGLITNTTTYQIYGTEWELYRYRAPGCLKRGNTIPRSARPGLELVCPADADVEMGALEEVLGLDGAV